MMILGLLLEKITRYLTGCTTAQYRSKDTKVSVKSDATIEVHMNTELKISLQYIRPCQDCGMLEYLGKGIINNDVIKSATARFTMKALVVFLIRWR